MKPFGAYLKIPILLSNRHSESEAWNLLQHYRKPCTYEYYKEEGGIRLNTSTMRVAENFNFRNTSAILGDHCCV